MQIGIQFHDTKELLLEERAKNVRAQGFSCIQLDLAKSIHENSVRNSALTPGYAMHLRRLFAKEELDVAVLGCYMNLANPEEEKLQEIIKRYKAQIRFASVLGAGVVGTETGAPNQAYVYEPACHTKEALNVLLRNLSNIVEYAQQMGVIVAIEPVYRHIVYNAKVARKVLDEIQSPNLQIILDPVNLLHSCNYHQQKDIVKEAVELLGDDIAVIHIKDYQMTAKGLISVPAGTGDMDYTDIMKFIKKEKPYIHTIIEYTNEKNSASTKKFVEDLYDATRLPDPKEGDYRRK